MADSRPLMDRSAGGEMCFMIPPAKTRKTSITPAENTIAKLALIPRSLTEGPTSFWIQESVDSSAVATGIIRRHIKKNSGRPRDFT